MKRLGSIMVLVGIFAIVLNFVGRVPKLLVWIYSWGETTAWIIKVGLIVIGATLYFIGKPKDIELE